MRLMMRLMRLLALLVAATAPLVVAWAPLPGLRPTSRAARRVPALGARQLRGTRLSSTSAEGDGPAGPSRLQVAALAAVPVVWGTYGASVKAMYGLAHPPPEVLFNTLCYVVSSSTLLAGAALAAGNGADEAEAKLTPTSLRAGAELGLYLFVGSTLQVRALPGYYYFHYYYYYLAAALLFNCCSPPAAARAATLRRTTPS